MIKESIWESNQYGKGKQFDLLVTDALTNKDYNDDSTLLRKDLRVLIQRIPAVPQKPIVPAPQLPKIDVKMEVLQPDKSCLSGVTEDHEYDEFGDDMFAVPETGLPQVSSSNVIQDAAPLTKEEEDRKIQALVTASAIDMGWQQDGQANGRVLRKGLCGKMTDCLDSRQGRYQSKTPPPHYICHRCNVPGHFIKHCPTNGDPAYDKKQVKPPTGIPQSMLVATSDGSYALPTGAVGILEPDEAPFLEAVEGLTRNDAPPVLPRDFSCPLCEKVMKYAALFSKCCYQSFCFECIKDYILSKSACVCGVKDVLADDILPNKAVRATINRMLESKSNYSNTEIDGSAFQFEPSSPRLNAQFPALSAVSEEQKQPLSFCKKEISSTQGKPEEGTAPIPSQPTSANVKASGNTDVSEVTRDSVSLKEPGSQESVPQAEGAQQKVIGEKVKKEAKKVRLVPSNETQSYNSQDFPAESVWNASYDPYWNIMQTGMGSYAPPYASYLPCMGYGVSSVYMPYAGDVLPEDPFAAQSSMVPPVHYGGQVSSRRNVSSMKQRNVCIVYSSAILCLVKSVLPQVHFIPPEVNTRGPFSHSYLKEWGKYNVADLRILIIPRFLFLSLILIPTFSFFDIVYICCML